MAIIRTLIALSICALTLAACGGGGKVDKRPCRDSFDRTFHCGSGLPWTDAQNFCKIGKFTRMEKLRFIGGF